MLRLGLVFWFSGTQKGFFKRRENYSAQSLINVTARLLISCKKPHPIAVLCLLNFFSDPKSSRKLKKKQLYILTSVFNIFNKVSWSACWSRKTILCVGSEFIMLFQHFPITVCSVWHYRTFPPECNILLVKSFFQKEPEYAMKGQVRLKDQGHKMGSTSHTSLSRQVETLTCIFFNFFTPTPQNNWIM